MENKLRLEYNAKNICVQEGSGVYGLDEAERVARTTAAKAEQHRVLSKFPNHFSLYKK